MATPQELADFWAEVVKNGNGFTPESVTHLSPNLSTRMEFYSVNPPKPKIKKIDLTVCIGSAIDMEVSNSNFTGKPAIAVGPLYHVLNSDCYTDGYNNFQYCRARENHWHHWLGGECPLPEGLVIKLCFGKDEPCTKEPRTKYSGERYASIWRLTKGNDRIVAFKVLGCAEGWEY